MPNIADVRETYGSTLAFVPERAELPFVLNRRGLLGCGVEVGVKQGEFSEHILRRWQGRHLISVDPWRTFPAESYVDIANVPQEVHDGFLKETTDRLAQFGDRSTIWRATSREASEVIPRHSLDFVYLDGRHDYASVLEDIADWWDKVRPGGILCGHDYLDGFFPTAGDFGVKRAVDEYFAARGLAVHATLLDAPWVSWMVEVPFPADLLATEDDADAETEQQLQQAVSSFQGGKTVSVNVATHQGLKSVAYRLNPEHMSQRIMLESLLSNRAYEPETASFITAALRPGDTFIDVGTHVGYFSMLAAAVVGGEGRVISFEPDERNFEHLLSHISLNDLGNVEAVNQAVGESDHVAQFFVNADNDGGHALWDVGLHDYNQISRSRPNTRDVEVASLDSYLGRRDVRSLKLIKIDAEGSELKVLQGAKRSLMEHRVPFVVAEVNRFALERMGTSEDELRSYMEGLGYETWSFSDDQKSLCRLGPNDRFETNYCFNLVFRLPDAPALSAA
jgi:FkbM family methyltransferase